MAHAELVVPGHGGSLKRSASPCFHKEPKYIDEWLGAANDDYSVIRWRRAATAHLSRNKTQPAELPPIRPLAKYPG
jgi:hypothetical protein